jgi:hypothetical protein
MAFMVCLRKYLKINYNNLIYVGYMCLLPRLQRSGKKENNVDEFKREERKSGKKIG